MALLLFKVEILFFPPSLQERYKITAKVPVIKENFSELDGLFKSIQY